MEKSLTADMLYLYAIVSRPELTPPALTGVAGESLMLVTAGDLAAVVGVVERGQVAQDEEQLWRHEAVVEALMDNRTVLPVRFGTLLTDEQALEALLVGNAGALRSDLERLNGRVELSVRLLWERRVEPAPEGPPASGRAYLVARQAEEQQERRLREEAAELADQLLAHLGPLVLAHTQRLLVTPHMPLTAAYLIKREQVGEAHTQLDRFVRARPELRLLCTGPWPAYHFVQTRIGSP